MERPFAAVGFREHEVAVVGDPVGEQDGPFEFYVGGQPEGPVIHGRRTRNQVLEPHAQRLPEGLPAER